MCESFEQCFQDDSDPQPSAINLEYNFKGQIKAYLVSKTNNFHPTVGGRTGKERGLGVGEVHDLFFSSVLVSAGASKHTNTVGLTASTTFTHVPESPLTSF